jgi:hypothetical protein
VESHLKHRDLVPLIQEGIPTHRDGGHLDQVFTNFGGSVNQIKTDFSDHSAFEISIQFQKEDHDFDIRTRKRKPT